MGLVRTILQDYAAPLLRGRRPIVREAASATAHVVLRDPRIKALLLGFENIGKSCEFGLVQRRWGANPIGLLRWNTVTPDALIATLGEGLAGIGALENVVLVTARNGEIFVRDTRWGLQMHTFKFDGEVDRDTLHRQMSERILFLKDKFLADLAKAKKIFVFSSQHLDVTTALALRDALRAHGPVRLLGVMPVGAAGAPPGRSGDVVKIDPHLCVGLLDCVGNQRHTGFHILYDDWVAVCDKAVALFAADQPAPAVKRS